MPLWLRASRAAGALLIDTEVCLDQRDKALEIELDPGSWPWVIDEAGDGIEVLIRGSNFQLTTLINSSLGVGTDRACLSGSTGIPSSLLRICRRSSALGQRPTCPPLASLPEDRYTNY